MSRKGVPAHLRNVRSKLSKTFHENERYNFESAKGWKIFYPIKEQVLLFRMAKMWEDFPSNYIVWTSVFTTVLRHLYRILLKESILCLYVGSALFMRLYIYPTLCVIGATLEKAG